MPRGWFVLAGAALLLRIPAPQAPDPRHVLIVSGLSGESQYAERFHQESARLFDALIGMYGVPRGQVRYLAEDPARDPARIGGRATRDEIVASLAAIAKAVHSGDLVLVVLIGHGSGGATAARFNLPGPDLAPADLVRALAPMTEARVVVVNTASAGGDFLPPLSAPGRIILTATKTGFERNQTEFAEPFIRAIADQTAGADGDKDGEVSLLEAFRYAKAEVARSYQESNRLLTEHAMLDDNGDGMGTADPALDAATGDGVLARRTVLGLGAAGRVPAGDTLLARLTARQDALRGQIDQLRARKDSLADTVYQAQLEDLLVELSEVTRRIRERRGPP